MNHADHASSKALCLFTCDSQPLAVALEAVAEVVEAARLVRIPLCPPEVLGLCALRREIIPVVRMVREGTRPREGSDQNHKGILILRTDQNLWGLAIDETTVAIVNDQVHPSGPEASSSSSPGVVGSVKRGEVVHAVIDPEPTWSHFRRHIQQWYELVRGHAG